MTAMRGHRESVDGARTSSRPPAWLQAWQSLFTALLLLAFFAQAITSATLKSPTFDEEFHVGRAYAYARARDLRMQQNHPPLVSALTGLPLLLMPELRDPTTIAGWDEAFLFTFADELFWRLGHDVDKMLFLARLPIILLGTLLGAFVSRWARQMYGSEAAVLSSVLFAFSPNLLAHTRLVTTDLAVTAFAFTALFSLWRYLRAPSWRRMALASAATGLALSSKLSALLLVPVCVMLAVVDVWRRSGSGPRRRAASVQAVLRCLVLFGVAGVVVWAFYGFEVRPWPGTRVLLPATSYLLNVRTVIGHAARGHGAFLMGQVSMHGWWYYFPITLVLKTPLVTLGLSAIALWDTLRGRRWGQEAAVLLFPATYFAFALTSSLDIGYRYILPLTPFLCLFAGKVASAAWLRPFWLRTRALPAVGVVYAAVTLSVFPHYLAYFNVLAGGPGEGYQYLVDSNLDWGQDLKLLKVFLDKRGVDEVWLGYFGSADPAYYGIRSRAIFPEGSSRPSDEIALFNPAPGWYAISATILQGPFSEEPDILDWFRRQTPVEKVGYSIFVYHVEPDDDDAEWIGACYGQESTLDLGDVSRRFGSDDLRTVGFDCGQTWVVPGGGSQGWYVVPLANDLPGTLAGEWLADSEGIYRQRGLRGGAAYTVYQWTGGAGSGTEEFTRQAWTSPLMAPDVDDVLGPVSVPADLGDQVSFLGYRTAMDSTDAGSELVVTTGWRVLARPSDPALAMFAHLVGPDGALSVGDALGFPAIQWSPGDVFYQMSRLPLPAEAHSGPRWVQVGFYSLATGERLPVLVGGEPNSDRLLLGPIQVGEDDHA